MSLCCETCSYFVGNKQILNNISLTLSPGEIVSLIGANGAGKTSLIKLFAREIQAVSGHVALNGKPLSSIGFEVSARHIAFLPQKSGLEFPFQVREVIEMGRYPQFTGKAFDQDIVSNVIEQFDLQKLEDRSYISLSGGEKQRVQIARVLAQLWDVEDAYYLFDEPTAPLDLAHQLAFFKLIRVLAEKGAGILLAIHDLNLAARFSDRVMLLKQGEVIAEGAPEDVMTADSIRLGFDVDVQIHRRIDDSTIQISY